MTIVGPRFDRLGNYRLYRGETRTQVVRIKDASTGQAIDLSGVALTRRLLEHDGDPIGDPVTATGVGTDVTFPIAPELTSGIVQVGTRYRIERAGSVVLEGLFVVDNGPALITDPSGDIDTVTVDTNRDVLVVNAIGVPGKSAAELAGMTPDAFLQSLRQPADDAAAAVMAAIAGYQGQLDGKQAVTAALTEFAAGRLPGVSANPALRSLGYDTNSGAMTLGGRKSRLASDDGSIEARYVAPFAF